MYKINVYTNKENIQILNNNKKNYYNNQEETMFQNTINEYENRINELEEQIVKKDLIIKQLEEQLQNNYIVN